MFLRTLLSGVLALCVATPVLAQAVDPRVTALEEQIRDLNGRIEELNFQILQMQDRFRRMQEDNELRFQQLEDEHSGISAEAGDRDSASRSTAEPARDEGTTNATRESTDEQELGEPPRTFGTITFDADGNVVSDGATGDAAADETASGDAGAPVDLLEGSGDGEDSTDSGGSPAATADDTVVAALPPTDDPEVLYRDSYEFILSGDYSTAEAGFRQHIDRFPDSGRAADAHFWLGEALLGQDRYREAAEAFLRANREFPESKKAPDMLLKLGISLAAMDQRDVACATYTEIGQRYPDVSQALKDRVKQEEALAGC